MAAVAKGGAVPAGTGRDRLHKTVRKRKGSGKVVKKEEKEMGERRERQSYTEGFKHQMVELYNRMEKLSSPVRFQLR